MIPRSLRTSLSWVILGSMVLPVRAASAAPDAAPASASNTTSGTSSKEMNIDVKGVFRGRFLVKRLVAPVTMNLEKLQDFPEDPSQKILLDPLPISQAAEFNPRSEVKGHAPFWPWVPAIPEPPFLRMVPPKNVKTTSWSFEVLNPQGQTVYRQRGTQGLPEELIWEGKDSEKKFAVVDRLYSCQLTITDDQQKTTVTQGRSVILPAMAYGAEDSQTIEVSLARLFVPGKVDIAADGDLLLKKIFESFRERGINKLYVRLFASQPDLASSRELALVDLIEKSLHLTDDQVKHDHSSNTTLRGEVASFWLKPGGGH